LTIFVQLETLAEILKQKRESNDLLLREVAAAVNIDQSLLSKFEKGERIPTPKQVREFAKYYHISEEQLEVVYLSDKIYQELKGNPLANQAIQLTYQKIQEFENSKIKKK